MPGAVSPPSACVGFWRRIVGIQAFEERQLWAKTDVIFLRRKRQIVTLLGLQHLLHRSLKL
jgi:hypothetical protein